jgi:D-mannonate dehydratase
MKPYVKYDEGFIDEGDVNMLAVMRALVRAEYTREVYPEHPRAWTMTVNEVRSAGIQGAADTLGTSMTSHTQRQCYRLR